MPKYKTKDTIEAILYTGNNYSEIYKFVKSFGLGEPGINNQTGIIQVSYDRSILSLPPNYYLIYRNDYFSKLVKEKFEKKYEPVH